MKNNKLFFLIFLISILVISTIYIVPYFDKKVDNKNEYNNFVELTLDNYLNASEEEYFVFVYNSNCKDCDFYKNELIKYNKKENSLKVYIININSTDNDNYNKLNSLFGTTTYSVLLHIENGKEVMRYFGTPDIYSLPKKG